MKSIALSLVTLFLSAALAPAQDENQQPAKNGQNLMVRELSPLKGDEFESQFLKMMIAHHESGIEMAELVDERAESSELKSFADKSAKKQRKDHKKMTNWLKKWHEAQPDKTALPEESRKKLQEQTDRLRGLSGEEFDKAFLEVMTSHHQDGIAMFELVDERADQSQLKSFAEKSIKHQRKEIEEMQSIRDN